MDTYIPFFWLAVIIIAVIAEGATAQLVSIWAVVGGIGALIAGTCGADLWIQCVVFVVLTAVALLATRPLAKKVMSFKKEDTNAGRYIGKGGIVTQEINNTIGQGQVTVLGSIWTARTQDGSILCEGAKVTVQAIEGVKLIVTQQKNQE